MIYALIFFFLVNLKSFTGPIAILKFLPLGVLVVGALVQMSPGKGRLYLRVPSPTSQTYMFLAFLMLWVISILRTARGGASVAGHTNDIGAILLFSLVMYQHVTLKFKRPVIFDEVFTRETLKMLLIPSSIILLLFLVYVVGYNNPRTEILRQGEEMVILKMLGFKFPKKGIPFSLGAHPNLFGIWAGATFVLNAIAIMVLQLPKKVKWLLYLNGIGIFGFLLFADSRGTLLSTVVTSALVYFTYKFRFQGVLRAVVLIVPFLPFIFITMMGILAQTSIAGQLARGDKGAENLSTLSARTVIWGECLAAIQDPQLGHFFGYGEHGQATAGVSARYAHIFPDDFYEDDLIVTHNFFFQAFFDIGYFGVFIMLAAILAAMNNAIYLYNRGFKAALIYIAFLVYFMLSGALESVFGNHFRSYSMVLIVVCTYIFAFRSEYDRMLATQSQQELYPEES